jgi:hypothetical protein
MTKIKLKVLSERQRIINKLLNEAKGGGKLSLPPLPPFEYAVMKQVQNLAKSPAFSISLSRVVENNKNRKFDNFDEAYEAIKKQLLPLTTELTAKAIELTINNANLIGKTRRVRITTSDSVAENKAKKIKIIVEKKEVLNEVLPAIAAWGLFEWGCVAFGVTAGAIVLKNPQVQRDLARVGKASGELISSANASFAAGTATLMATHIMQMQGIRTLQPMPAPVDLPRAEDEPAPAPPPELPVGGGGEPPKGPNWRDLLKDLQRKAAEYCIGNMGEDVALIYAGIIARGAKMDNAMIKNPNEIALAVEKQIKIKKGGWANIGKGLNGILRHLRSIRGVICQTMMAYAAGLAIDVVGRQMNKTLDNDLELEEEWLAWSRTVGYKGSGGLFWNFLFMTADLLLSTFASIELSDNIENIARGVGLLPKHTRLQAFILNFYYLAAKKSGLIGDDEGKLMTEEELKSAISSAATKKMTNARDITAKMVEVVLKKLVEDYNKAILNIKEARVGNRKAQLEAFIEKNRKIASFFNNAAEKIEPEKTQQWGSLIGFDSKKVAEGLQNKLRIYGNEFDKTAARLQAIADGKVKADASFYDSLKTIDADEGIDHILNRIKGIKATTKPKPPVVTTAPRPERGYEFD